MEFPTKQASPTPACRERFHLFETIIKDPARISINHFKILFDFGYYICMTPFRFEIRQNCISEDSLNVSLKSSSFRIVLTKLFYWLSIAGHFWGSLIKMYSQSADVIKYFNAAHLLIHLWMMVLFHTKFFANSGNCFKLMIEAGTCRFLKFGNEKKEPNKLKKWKYLSIIYHIFLVTVVALTNIIAPLYSKNWNWTKLFFMYAAHSKMIFAYKPENLTKSDIASLLRASTANLECQDILIGIISFIVLSASAISSAYRVTSFLHPTSTLLYAVNRFNAEVNTFLLESTTDVKKNILYSYSQLKQLNDLYTDIWGSMTLASMLDYIVWLSTDLDTGLQATNWVARASVTWYFLAIVIPLMAGGEINRKMSKFKVTILRHRKRIFDDRNELEEFLHCLDHDGVRFGMNGVFYLDYAYFGHISVLIVTLFLITLPYERVYL